MQLPAGYTFRASDADHDEHPDWQLVENVAMYTDNVGVEPADHQIGALIDGPDGETVAAMWYSTENETFSFHLVTIPEHQGCGIGSALLDAATSLYRQFKTDGTVHDADICAVNPKVVHGLFNRGFCALNGPDLHDMDPDSFCVYIREAPPLQHFLERALQTNSSKFLHAVALAAEPGVATSKDGILAVKQWFQSPNAIDSDMQSTLEAVAQALPLDELDVRYVWAQIQQNAPQYHAFPTPLLPPEIDAVEPEATPSPALSLHHAYRPHRR